MQRAIPGSEPRRGLCAFPVTPGVGGRQVNLTAWYPADPVADRQAQTWFETRLAATLIPLPPGTGRGVSPVAGAGDGCARGAGGVGL
jgi:hypothetical protein